MFTAIADGFDKLFSWLGSLFSFLLDGLLKLLQPILDLIAGIFYLLYLLGVLIVKVLKLLVAVGKLLLGLVAGLFKTITGLSYTGAPAAMPASYNNVFARLQPVFDTLQFDKLAYVVMFAISVMTIFTALKIIGGMRGGS